MSGNQKAIIETSNEMLQDQWDNLCNQLKNEVGDINFESWIKPMSPGSIKDGQISLYVPTNFMKNWVVTNYSERIKMLWNKHNPSVKNVTFVVKPGAPKRIFRRDGTTTISRPMTTTSDIPVPRPQGRAPLSYSSRKGYGPAGTWSAGEDTLSSLSAPLDPKYTFDNFVVGKPNEFAYAAARRVAESNDVGFNPLFLYSGVGLGKTHLMHAIAWHIREKDPSRTVAYLSAEKFMYRFVQAIRYKDNMTFKEQFRAVDVLMVDDVQFLCNKEATQDEFFHTFNSLIEDKRQIILSADKSPSSLEGIEMRLKSRLGCGLVADIHPTNFELRLGILESKAEQLGIRVPAKVMEFLAHKITANVRELEGALQRVVAHAQLLSGCEISLELAQNVLKDMLRAYDRRVTIDEIQKKVSEHFNIPQREMHSKRRARSVARPRQVAMYLAKQLTSRSLPEIGRKFERDHTTVMHAVRKIEELCAIDSSLAEDVELLRRMLEN
jgi:chromosomal replication initiator protein